MTTPEFHILQVGQPYIQGRTSLPEAVQFNFRAGAHELLMWLPAPTEREVRDIARGDAELALFVEQPLIIFLYRFGRAIPWSDAPYSWHRVPEQERVLPDPVGVAEPHALLQVVLADAATGIVRALRAIALLPAFTTALHLAIRDQAAAHWDPAAYDRALDQLYARISPEALAARSHTRMLSVSQRQYGA